MKPAPFRVGTGHWRSEAEARRAYCWGFDEAFAEGAIKIGPPEISPGDRLLVDKTTGRYIIGVGYAAYPPGFQGF